MYSALADIEKDDARAEVLRKLVQAEMRHATRWGEKLGMDPDTLRPRRSGLKVRLITWAARRFGLVRVIPMLLRGEARDISAYASDPEARGHRAGGASPLPHVESAGGGRQPHRCDSV